MGFDYFDAKRRVKRNATRSIAVGIEDLLCLVFVHTDKLPDSRGRNEN